MGNYLKKPSYSIFKKTAQNYQFFYRAFLPNAISVEIIIENHELHVIVLSSTCKQKQLTLHIHI